MSSEGDTPPFPKLLPFRILVAILTLTWSVQNASIAMGIYRQDVHGAVRGSRTPILTLEVCKPAVD